MKTLIMTFFVMCMYFPAYAQGSNPPGPSREEALLIAERWIASEGLENPCIGKLKINVVDYPHIDGVEVHGHANGWRGQVWDPTLCDITIESGLTLVGECEIIAHEYMHIVRGPEHTGPLSPESSETTECRVDKRSPRQILYASVRETLPTGYNWKIRCSQKYCVATSLRARHARRIRFRFLYSGLLIGEWNVERTLYTQTKGYK